VVLEAMAYGKPVIGSDLGGVSEIIDNGRDGLLFDAGNVEALKSKMERLIGDDSLVRELGTAARKRIEEQFSIERHYARLSAIFDDVRQQVEEPSEDLR
jgi:glycosyltransferase involved in cell wall biosynthesis